MLLVGQRCALIAPHVPDSPFASVFASEQRHGCHNQGCILWRGASQALLRSSWRQEMGRVLVFLLATLAAYAQQASNVLPEQTIRVPLKTARGTMQSMGVGIALNADASGQLKATLPGGLEARM